MVKIFLQDIIEELPTNWNSFNLESFSKSKKLWDYQKDALKNAIKVLWKYFEDFVDYQRDLEASQERKQKFFNGYRDNGLPVCVRTRTGREENLDIKLDRKMRNIHNLLTEYYPREDRKILIINLI